mmetsp:Transcript_13219/g.48159  ORF Transcript_13219/g.48159 Transcript_13219/m.48159 type:complete len:126 (-) Transcript_13219:453-830(-)
MVAAEGECNIRFRFGDKPDLGPFKYHLSTTVGNVKEMLLSDLNSKDNENGVTVSAKDVRLIHAGKVLEDPKTLQSYQVVGLSDESGNPFVNTMHVSIRPPAAPKTPEKRDQGNQPSQCLCTCVVS